MAAYSRDQGTLLKNPGDYMGPEMHEIVHLATARDVTFYTLDSRGLYTPMGAAFDASDEPQITRMVVLLPEIQQEKETMALENQDALAELAAATGGVFVRNTNDLAQECGRPWRTGANTTCWRTCPATRRPMASSAKSRWR